jgi:hypothetical protein
MDYSSIIRYICDIFNTHSVEYMIVGGTAVALYKKFRDNRVHALVRFSVATQKAFAAFEMDLVAERNSDVLLARSDELLLN